jgi:DNA-binding IclR family transcriptional regulator
MTPTKRNEIASAVKVLAVLDVLSRNFMHGFTQTELARETGFDTTSIHRYVNALISANYAEIIQETGRIRPSIRYAQIAIGILNNVESAAQRVSEIRARLARNASINN